MRVGGVLVGVFGLRSRHGRTPTIYSFSSRLGVEASLGHDLLHPPLLANCRRDVGWAPINVQRSDGRRQTWHTGIVQSGPNMMGNYCSETAKKEDGNNLARHRHFATRTAVRLMQRVLSGLLALLRCVAVLRLVLVRCSGFLRTTELGAASVGLFRPLRACRPE